jgi:hypothetical protein
MTTHCLGRFVLDEWEPELLVKWTCPSPHSHPFIVALDPGAPEEDHAPNTEEHP